MIVFYFFELAIESRQKIHCYVAHTGFNGGYPRSIPMIRSAVMYLSKLQNVFVQIGKCIFYITHTHRRVQAGALSSVNTDDTISSDVFVQITKCICPNWKMYFLYCTHRLADYPRSIPMIRSGGASESR